MLNRKALISATLATTLAVSGLAAAVPAFAAETTAVTTTASTSIFQIAADAEISAQLKNFADIKAMFTLQAGQTLDFAAVQAAYIEKFQPAVKKIDATIAKGNPLIDENISAVLALGVQGKLTAGQVQQAIDKGLQWYFYFLIKYQVNTLAKPALEKGDTVTAKAELDKAIQIYEGVTRSNLEKRDNKYKTMMKDLVDKTVIPALQADITNKDVASFNIHRQMLDKTIIKNYTLATLTYAEVTPGKPAADQPTAMTEGYFLFLPVYSYLKGGSPADADFVLNAFASGDVSKIDYAAIKAALTRANIGKVSEYVKRAGESLEAGQTATAQVLAMEGLMFLAALETYFGDAAAYADASAHGQAFFEAVMAGDKATTEKEGFIVLQSISKLDGISLAIGTPSLTVKGQKIEVDAAPFIHPETSRTLVPARFIAEALGATVDWVDATRTVVIEKDGVKTELTIGGDTVIQGGKAVESLKLDQPALLHGERTFVPLRAIAELFGNKVFYVNGEIVIVK